MHTPQIAPCSQLEDRLQCLQWDNLSKCKESKQINIKEDSMSLSLQLPTDSQLVVFNFRSIINKINFMETHQEAKLLINNINNNSSKRRKLRRVTLKEGQEVNFIDLKIYVKH